MASPEDGDDFECEESPRQVTVLEDFLEDNLDQHPDDREIGSPSWDGNADLDEEISKKRPKWWKYVIGDVRDDEMIEGRSSRGKSK